MSKLQLTGRGPENFIDELACASAQVFKARSARFVLISSGVVNAIGNSPARIDGAINCGDKTLTTTDKIAVDISLERQYEIPIKNAGTNITAAQALAAVGLIGDVYVSGGYQYLDMSDVSNALIVLDKVVEVLSIDIVEQTAWVKLNPKTQFAQ